MILLVVTLELKEGKKEECISIAKQLVEGSQKEEGNIEYNFYQDLDKPNTVAFIEKWKDQDAINTHEKFDYFANNIGKLVSLCAKPLTVNKFDVLN